MKSRVRRNLHPPNKLNQLGAKHAVIPDTAELSAQHVQAYVVDPGTQFCGAEKTCVHAGCTTGLSSCRGLCKSITPNWNSGLRESRLQSVVKALLLTEWGIPANIEGGSEPELEALAQVVEPDCSPQGSKLGHTC